MKTQIKWLLGKSILIICNIKGCNADHGGKKTYFHLFHPSQDGSLQSLDGKCTDLIGRKWTSKCLFPHRHLFNWRVAKMMEHQGILCILYLTKGEYNKNTNIHHLHVQLITNLLVSSYSFRKEEKLVALPIYSSFIRVAIGRSRTFP